MLKRSVCRGNQFSKMSRWAVEEMGRNSVIPSMIPRMIIAIQSGIAQYRLNPGPWQGATRNL